MSTLYHDYPLFGGSAPKRVTLFAGHYGSGKTNIAVDTALALKQSRAQVAIADLDIVNPYFRTKDAEKWLEEAGVRLIVSPYANSNVDVPALPAETYAILDNPDLTAVVDVGGDDRGALALGRYAESIVRENDYAMLLVINKYRPLTRTGADAVEVMREIEQAGNIRFTGIVNNSNLGDETTAEDVLSSRDYAAEIAEKTGLPLVMTTVKAELLPELTGKIEHLFPLSLYVKQAWARGC